MNILTLVFALLLALSFTISPAPVEAQLEPPHVLIGQARSKGQPAIPGTPIEAWDKQTKIGEAAVAADGMYILKVSKPRGRTIIFTVGGISASENLATWGMGEIQRDFDLSANDQLVGEVPASRIAQVMGTAFVRAFAFDNATKEWLFYNQSVAEYSTLTTLTPERPYLFLVSRDYSIALNGKMREFACRNGKCWNQVVW